MNVVINEVEVLEGGGPASGPAPAPVAHPVEPAREQLLRLQRDLEGRARRLVAD